MIVETTRLSNFEGHAMFKPQINTDPLGNVHVAYQLSDAALQLSTFEHTTRVNDLCPAAPGGRRNDGSDDDKSDDDSESDDYSDSDDSTLTNNGGE